MSTSIDNIVLAKLSLKEALSTYLDANSWSDQYSIYLYGDPDLAKRDIVLTVSNPRSEVALPLITVSSGSVQNIVEELGSSTGNDHFVINVVVAAKDSVQLDTLANVVRRKLHELAFTIYDYSSQRHSSLGTGLLTDVQLSDLTDMSQEKPANKFVAVINATLEIPSTSFLS